MSTPGDESSSKNASSTGDAPNDLLAALLKEMQSMNARFERMERGRNTTPPPTKQNLVTPPKPSKTGRDTGTSKEQPDKETTKFDDFEEYEHQRQFGDYYNGEVHAWESGSKRDGYEGRRRPAIDDDLTTIKFKLPKFDGKGDPEVFWDWQTKVEFMLEGHNYSGAKKVKLATNGFEDYALIWWNQVQSNRRSRGSAPIITWEGLMDAMRERFVPLHYMRELRNKFQRLTQGDGSVDAYYNELEVLKLRLNVQEGEEEAMSRFLGGLNEKILSIVEFYPYHTLVDLVHLAGKAERQTKVASESASRVKASVPAPKASSLTVETSKVPAITTTKNKDIVCFRCQEKGHIASQCPVRRTMTVSERMEHMWRVWTKARETRRRMILLMPWTPER